MCLLSLCARVYIRIRLQHRLGIDDFFLMLGLCFLVSAMTLRFLFLDTMYIVEGIEFHSARAFITPNVTDDLYRERTIDVASMILACGCIASVKLSFLFLFRKLIDGIRPLTIYWYIVTIFNITTSIFSAVSVYSPCPYLDSLKMRKLCMYLVKLLQRELILPSPMR